MLLAVEPVQLGLDLLLLEQALEPLELVQALVHEVRGQLGRSTAIAIVDCGLTPEGRHRAEILTRRFGRVTVLQREELEQIVE